MDYPSYKDAIRIAARNQLPPDFPLDAPDPDGIYRLDVTVYMAKASNGDWDNLGGSASDALEKLIYKNDHQIREGRVIKEVDKSRKELSMTVSVYRLAE